MDKKELLRSVLQNFINDKPDEAKADFHQYLTLKSKEVTGIGASQTQETTSEPEVTPPATEVTPDPATDPAATE